MKFIPIDQQNSINPAYVIKITQYIEPKSKQEDRGHGLTVKAPDGAVFHLDLTMTDGTRYSLTDQAARDALDLIASL